MNAFNARTNARLGVERKILLRYFPGAAIQFPDDRHRAGVVVPLMTMRQNRYVLWVSLNGFPIERPQMYVIEPVPLRDCRGKKLSKRGVSCKMHLLEPDAHGHPQICHHNDASWTPNIALCKVVTKGLIWLEAYELHLASGKAMDRYLPHMG